METRLKCKSNRSKMKKIVLGLLIASAGALLLGFNLGYLPIEYKDIIFSWPMILIALGLVNISAKESRFSGILLLAIGSFFISPRFFSFDAQVAWPILLIFGGLLIVFKKGFNRRKYVLEATCKSGETREFEQGKIFENNVLGGSKVRFENEVFKGGEINNVFGGSDIDLTGCSLSDGINELEINCIFGGVKLTIPNDWAVQMKVVSILGGFSDKRTNFGKTYDATNKKTLIIKGTTIFGGGEIKSI